MKNEEGTSEIDFERIKSDPEYRQKMMAERLRSMANKMEAGEVKVEVEGGEEDAGSKAPCPCKSGGKCPKGKEADEMVACRDGKCPPNAAAIARESDNLFDKMQAALDAAREAYSEKEKGE